MVHVLQVLVIQEPDFSVLLILVKGDGETVCDVENTPEI